jgi:hypothetical protein
MRNAEHLLGGLYYLGRQICKEHINRLGRLYGLLPVEDPSEMEDVLWQLLEFQGTIEAFKAEHSDLFEAPEDDD